MKVLILIFAAIALLTSCEEKQTSSPSNQIYYCVHNGYGNFNPICSKMESMVYGLKLTGCEIGNRKDFTLYNPTNVTECRK